MAWSILARNPATGTLGAAVTPRFFVAGGLCIHFEGRAAALAIQALVSPMYAVHAMPHLRLGEDPAALIIALTGPDPGCAQRRARCALGRSMPLPPSRL